MYLDLHFTYQLFSVFLSTAHQLYKLFLLLRYYRCCYVNNEIGHNELAFLQ